MERRVLLVIFLCFIVLYLWNVLVIKPVPRQATAPAATTPAASPKPAGSGPSAEVAPPSAPPKAVGTAVIGEASEREVRVETRDVIAVFTNRGALLKSWRLRRYLDQDKQPQELVVPQFDSQPLPFSLEIGDEQGGAAINAALYSVSETSADASSAAGSKKLRFEYSTVGPVLHVVKEFELPAEGYVVTFRASVSTASSTENQNETPVPYAIAWGPAVGDLGEVSRYAQKPEALLAQDAKARRLAPKDISKDPLYQGDFRYAGVDDNYFMTAALSLSGAKVRYQPVSIPPPPNSKEPPRELVAYSVETGSASTPVQFFVGPKDVDVLSALNMKDAINFGMFAIIVGPLLTSLKWVHSYVGNYGWSIVILTIIVNAIMFPARHKSAVSMRKMQEVQPEAKSIQDRYAKLKATDPARQKMNQELMALYRERGVNPAGGCVPMLLTMPVFLAMWALLQTSIELRGAPWFGWIHDLSSHDRFFVLPLLMVASQFWQQRMMPAAGADPTQQKMMMFMPVVMGFIFLWLPAGALIYYVVSNFWAIGQQYVTNRLLGPLKVRTLRPAAERRVKRVGGGKSEAAGRES